MSKTNLISTGFLCSFIFLVVFFGPLIITINNPQGSHDDLTYQYFLMENNLSKLSSLDFGHIYQARMFYPHPNSALFGNSYLGQAILGLPFYLTSNDPITSTNLVILLNFALSFLGAFLLCFKLTKNLYGSVIGGIIYSFNPFIRAHDQLELLTHQWIPFIFLSLENLLNKVSWKNSLLLALLLLLQLICSVYYFIFLIVSIPFFLLFRLRLLKISPLIYLKRPVIFSTLFLISFSYLYLMPSMAVKEKYHISRSLSETENYSAQLSDFLFPRPTNFLYGNFFYKTALQNMRDPELNIHYTEHSLFTGFIPLFLFLIYILIVLKHKLKTGERTITLPYFIVGFVVLILSFGPFIYFFGFKIPSFYLLLYNLLPFLDALRVPSRFMVVGFLSIAICASLSWKYIIPKLGRYNKFFSIIIISLICLEYFNILPPTYSVPQETKQFYSFLDAQKNVKIIVELPIANHLQNLPNIGRAPIEDSQYLLYATLHSKILVNGYHSFSPKDSIILGNELSIGFPNYQKIADLKKMGVDTIVVHLDEYTDVKRGLDIITHMETSSLLQKIYSSNQIYAFKII
jgi:hypothetical protein